jgi:hypothetical protein
MKKGIALTIGVNFLDKIHYGGWSGALNCCENESMIMAKLLDGIGYNVANIRTKNATREKIIKSIYTASQKLKSGDIFVLYFSGHGGQLVDGSGDEWNDSLDETWCLYDGQLLDDELYHLWTKFREDVRILLISDSCHSGTIVKNNFIEDGFGITKNMPFDVSEFVYSENKEFYDNLLDNLLKDKLKRYDIEHKIGANILLLAACQDNQTAIAGNRTSLFTNRLLKVWRKEKFLGDYRRFHGSIIKRMPSRQSPNYVLLGKPNKAFERQKPFQI